MPQLIRQVNARRVLGALAGGAPLTSTELVDATGLTRATVHAVCQDLIEQGWVLELENQRSSKGRPSRRFQFNERAGYVLGIDVGAAKTTVLLADLHGDTVARSGLPFSDLLMPSDERVDTIDRAVRQAMDTAGVGAKQILAVTAGVPAPVDRAGKVTTTDRFWGIFDIGLSGALTRRYGWSVQLENDANLAALGERWRGVARGVDDLIVLIAGERVGAGCVESGRLLHGRQGGVGEMAYLKQVRGVGSAEGIAALARQWGAEAIADSPLLTAYADADPSAVTSEMVFAAAANGDTAARAVLARIASRMARIVASLGDLLNPELVVLAGAVADSVGALLADIEAQLPTYTYTPPRLAASMLGDIVVATGAVRHALDCVEANRLS
ncbi:ROK family transcriptional regulator [Fodinicola acaciae]|uniref:ROK family transcriptional regulator n=1 Tax=Fodinicola acaciae TaxID=2681555 RepID=UPI0013D52F62|nr:ROK family transcriptional regulator [Fodinicola acaciae]